MRRLKKKRRLDAPVLDDIALARAHEEVQEQIRATTAEIVSVQAMDMAELFQEELALLDYQLEKFKEVLSQLEREMQDIGLTDARIRVAQWQLHSADRKLSIRR